MFVCPALLSLMIIVLFMIISLQSFESYVIFMIISLQLLAQDTTDYQSERPMAWWCPGCGFVVGPFWAGPVYWVFQIDNQYPYHQYGGHWGYWQAWHIWCWEAAMYGSMEAKGGA